MRELHGGSRAKQSSNASLNKGGANGARLDTSPHGGIPTSEFRKARGTPRVAGDLWLEPKWLEPKWLRNTGYLKAVWRDLPFATIWP